MTEAMERPVQRESESGALEPVKPATSSRVEVRDRGFLALLTRLDCAIALSSDDARLILIGPGRDTISLSAVVLPRMRGLAAHGNLIAAGAADSVHVFHTHPGLAETVPDALDTFDAVYVPRATHFTGRCDLHDMAFVGGAIIAVNTRYSCICRVDGRHSFTPIWRPPFITAIRPEDRCHLNGMALLGNELRYVSMLGMSDEPGGWRESFVEGGGALMEAATGRVVAQGLSLPHSPRIIGGRLMCLESGRGHLVDIDVDSGESTILARLPGFTHGLSERGGVLFIGVSKLRARRPRKPIPLETEGIEPICGVIALDAHTFATLATLELSSGAEEIYDLQLLPGVRSPTIRSLEEAQRHHAIDLPGEAFWVSEVDLQS
jgi:uncharacterized protein (TIGR03032 family)